MILGDPMDFTWTSTASSGGGGQIPRASRYRYSYRASMVVKSVILFLLTWLSTIQ